MDRDGKLPFTGISESGMKETSVALSIDATTASIVPFVSAAGECLSVFLVLKSKTGDESSKRSALFFKISSQENLHVCNKTTHGTIII